VPLPVSHGKRASSLAITDAGHVILAQPGLQRLLDVRPLAFTDRATRIGTIVCRIGDGG
jgi:hypothetical protein